MLISDTWHAKARDIVIDKPMMVPSCTVIGMGAFLLLAELGKNLRSKVERHFADQITQFHINAKSF